MSYRVPSYLEIFRTVDGLSASNEGDQFGAFLIRHSAPPLDFIALKDTLQVIVSGPTTEDDPIDIPWEHVSATFYRMNGRNEREFRLPTWPEMCAVKRIFWEPQDVVVQFHPAESEYVNLHEHVLHLWRPTADVMPTPPSIAVGPKLRRNIIPFVGVK